MSEIGEMNWRNEFYDVFVDLMYEDAKTSQQLFDNSVSCDEDMTTKQCNINDGPHDGKMYFNFGRRHQTPPRLNTLNCHTHGTADAVPSRTWHYATNRKPPSFPGHWRTAC